MVFTNDSHVKLNSMVDFGFKTITIANANTLQFAGSTEVQSKIINQNLAYYLSTPVTKNDGGQELLHNYVCVINPQCGLSRLHFVTMLYHWLRAYKYSFQAQGKDARFMILFYITDSGMNNK